MKEELDFKGNFYETVKRKSQLMRESLESEREERKEAKYSPRRQNYNLRVRNFKRKIKMGKSV